MGGSTVIYGNIYLCTSHDVIKITIHDLVVLLKQNKQKTLCKGHSLNSGRMAMYQSVHY